MVEIDGLAWFQPPGGWIPNDFTVTLTNTDNDYPINYANLTRS